MGYFTNFIVYLLAMTGVILLALFVFKQATGCKLKSGGSKLIKVIDTLSLTPRKTLYVVSAGNEKFLIAGDAERTSLISKLDNLTDGFSRLYQEENKASEVETIRNYREISVPKRETFMDKSVVGINSTQNSPYESVMKSLAEKMRS